MRNCRAAISVVISVILGSVTFDVRASDRSHVPLRCLDQAVHAITRGGYSTEKSFLASFDPAKTRLVEIRNLTELSGSVYYLRTADGHEFVMRIDNSTNNVRRELFASRLLSGMLELETPELRLMSPSEVSPLLRQAKASDPEWSKHEDKYLLGRTTVSLATFHSMERGREVIEGLGVRDKVRATILELVHASPADVNSYMASRIRGLKSEWASLSHDQKHDLEQDLAELMPEYKGKTGQAFIDYLTTHALRLRKSNASRLDVLAYERLPQKLRTQLADYWAIYTILGIPDFHPGNWIFKDGKVVAIDLAHPAMAAKKGSVTALPMQQHPIAYAPLKEPLRFALESWVSPGLRNHFKHLTKESVKHLADESGYKISEKELDQIMQRVDHFAR